MIKIAILGGGIAGTSLGHIINKKNEITILESASHAGGLARSFFYEGFHYDIGPHIIFSKNKEVLNFMLNIDSELMIHSRSNQIWYKNQFIRYPFENNLYKLNSKEKNECLYSFLNNPYRDLKPNNMLQFFLSKFGSGITERYLYPYNKKIWKYDPTFLDLQMVERIPNPPPEDVISGAEGVPKEGYQHQAKFYYPKIGGIQSFFDKLQLSLPKNVNYKKNHEIVSVSKKNNKWVVKCKNGYVEVFDKIINCMPIHNFINKLDFHVPKKIKSHIKDLKFNSMFCGIIVFSEDYAGNNFSLNIPDEQIIFHRVSKLNFLGANHPKNKSAFLFEITYRKDMKIASFDINEIKNKVISGFQKMGIAKKRDFIGFEMKVIEKAYVIYDLNHRKNTDCFLSFLENNEISSLGRFAEFEYLNMDHVIERAFNLVRTKEL